MRNSCGAVMGKNTAHTTHVLDAGLVRFVRDGCSLHTFLDINIYFCDMDNKGSPRGVYRHG